MGTRCPFLRHTSCVRKCRSFNGFLFHWNETPDDALQHRSCIHTHPKTPVAKPAAVRRHWCGRNNIRNSRTCCSGSSSATAVLQRATSLPRRRAGRCSRRPSSRPRSRAPETLCKSGLISTHHAPQTEQRRNAVILASPKYRLFLARRCLDSVEMQCTIRTSVALCSFVAFAVKQACVICWGRHSTRRT